MMTMPRKPSAFGRLVMRLTSRWWVPHISRCLCLGYEKRVITSVQLHELDHALKRGWAGESDA